MMRRSSLALALLLGACTSQGFNPILVEAVKVVNPLQDDSAKPQGNSAPVTREAINRADIAAVFVRLANDEGQALLYAASNNGGFVTYSSRFRQTVTLRGSQITATRGLGWDLLSAKSSQPDPLTRAIPPAQWPAMVRRSYEFPSDSPEGRIETYDCRFEFGAVSEMVILQQAHRGVQVSETCSGTEGAFENLHFADVSSGFVWRSLQWTGPRQGLLDLQIVLPYTGGR